MNKPYVWQMIKEAVENLDGPVSYSDIRNYINNKWNDINQGTIRDQITVLTVNHKSRIHYNENKKPRLTNSHSQYDFLFKTDKGQVEKYNCNEHGIWEIFKDKDKKLAIRQYSSPAKIFTYAILTELEITNPELTATEGKQQLVSHIVKERNRKIVNEKKQQAIKNNNLKCEVCSFSFSATYANDFIECHHIIPIGQAGIRETRLEDLALVCANCHRMLHKKFDGQYLSINQLQERICSLQKIAR